MNKLYPQNKIQRVNQIKVIMVALVLLLSTIAPSAFASPAAADTSCEQEMSQQEMQKLVSLCKGVEVLTPEKFQAMPDSGSQLWRVQKTKDGKTFAPVLFATNRALGKATEAKNFFSENWDPKQEIRYAVAILRFDREPNIAELENLTWAKTTILGKMKWRRVAPKVDHIFLCQNKELFFDLLAQSAKETKRATVFGHGSFNGWPESIQRAAGLKISMEQKAFVTFDWVTQGKFGASSYKRAEDSARWSTEHFLQFKRDLAQAMHGPDGDPDIKLTYMYHSMGNRIDGDVAIRQVDQCADGKGTPVDLDYENILVSPDIERQFGFDQIVPAVCRVAKKVTIAMSGRDMALGALSRTVNGGTRLGELTKCLPVVENVTFFVFTKIDSMKGGHSIPGEALSYWIDSDGTSVGPSYTITIVREGVSPIVVVSKAKKK